MTDWKTTLGGTIAAVATLWASGGLDGADLKVWIAVSLSQGLGIWAKDRK